MILSRASSSSPLVPGAKQSDIPKLATNATTASTTTKVPSPGRGIEIRLKTAEARFKLLSDELKILTEEKEKKEQEEIGDEEIKRMRLVFRI